MPIPPKITNDALEAYCYCAQKFHLKRQGEHGVKSEYEIVRAELRSDVKIRDLNRRCKNSEPSSGLRLTQARLQRTSQYIFDGIYEDNDFKLHIDGIEKIADARDSRKYSFRPILFSGSIRTEKQQRMILRTYGHALSTIIETQVPVGLISSRDGTTKVPLILGGNDFPTWLEQLLAARRATTPPPLFLNDHCQVCEFQTHCRKRALDEGNLSLLKGMTPNEVAKYNAKGLFTINQILYTFRARRKPKRARNKTGPHYFSLQAQALREKKIFVHGSIDFKINAPRIYFDIEGNPDNGIDYLIGALKVDKDKHEFVSFWAEQDEQRCRIFADFLRYISTLPQHHLVHFGSYETTALRRAKSFLPPELWSALDDAISRSTNLLSVIRTRLYFPTYSNSLKEIGGFLGATWSHPSPSGILALVWRERWLRTNNPMWSKRLLQYNRDDCHALKRVADYLDDVVSKQDLPRQANSEASLVFTDTLPKSERKGRIFRKNGFAISEFERINQCAYFDYQRDRIAARSGRPTKQRYRKGAKRPRWKLWLNKTVHIVVKRCPECRSRKVKAGRSIARTVTDLKLSTTGVKRWVVRYLTNEYKCEKCYCTFTPAEVPPIGSKFGWGLAAWCIYNHVEAGQNLSRVTTGLGHLFRLSVPQPTVHRFKEYVSDHYRQYCRDLFSELIRGPYLHIDETPVKLKSQTGYVWIVTNGNTAYYFYRSSREGAFLRDFLKDFCGVLISDFFTAYDSLELRQQRCLIHLLRDFNEELLKAPYDEELRMVGNRFSSILGPIVSTIDDRGLKKRYLSKHKAGASKFVEWIAETKFDSRPASKLQARITKYDQMLFTFLDYDGVSWNNNNAERAIKTFARYRRFADGRLTIRSIERYLIILSVYQTCEFRGIDFLDFLLGRTSLGSRPPVPWILNSSISKAHADSEPLPGFDGAEVGVEQGRT